MKKKIISIALVACMLVSVLAGCGKSGGNSNGSKTQSNSSPTNSADDVKTTPSATADYTKAGGAGEVVVGISGDPQNMGPWAGMSLGRIAVLFTTYEYLVTLEDGKYYGALAKEWNQIDDTTYDVEIYDYIHDTAGNKLTSADIVYSFETAIATKNYGKLSSIVSVKALDDYNVEFKFDKTLEMGQFEDVMLECAIVAKAAYEASSDQMATDPVGTTAYKVTKYVPGSSIVFEDTGDYWQTDESLIHNTSKHNTSKITMNVITEASQMTVAMQTNSIDISNGIPDSDIDKFKEGGQYAKGNTVATILDNPTYDLEYNMSADSVFKDDLNLRLAIACAIDKDGLNTGAFNGNGLAVRDFANPNYPDYNTAWDSQDYYNYNIDTAKDYVGKSSYSGQKLRLMYISTPAMDMICQMVQSYLSQVGINVELSGYDSMMFQQAQYDSKAFDFIVKQNGSTNYIVNQWKLCWDARDYEKLTGGASNFTQDDKLQSLLEATLNTKTYGPDAINAFHDYLVENCYGYGLVQGTINIVQSNYITNVVLDPRNQILPGACTFAE